MVPLLARTALVAVFVLEIGNAAGADFTTASPGHALFAAPNLPRFHIEIASDELARLRFGGLDYAHATVRVDGLTLPDVGIRLKGRGSFRPVTDRPSLAVKFDAFQPRQNLFGLTKVMLNNASQDSTLLSEYLASGLFRDAGVPAARVTHARVVLNGRELGFYVVAEAMNKAFLREHFDNPYGSLYEGYARDIDQVLDQDSGPPGNQLDRQTLVVAAQSPASERWYQLRQTLDVERFVSFLCVTILSAQHDSYPLNRNNFRLYRDPSADRFVMIPHGIDGSFSQISMPIEPPQRHLLTRAVMELPEGQQLYRRRLGEIFTNVFNLERITNRIQEAADRLSSAAADETERTARRTGATSMLRRVARRHQNVLNQLEGRISTRLTFGSDGRAPLSGWEPELGAARMRAERERVDNMETLCLRVDGSPGIATGSWRTFVSLSPGTYRFLGRVRVSGVTEAAAASSTGAALRISGNSGAARFAGNDAWQLLEHRFTVREPGDVQLVCELRAAQGQAWFDLSSLQLVRE